VILTRKQILTIGPILLVTACYIVAAPSRLRSNPTDVANVSEQTEPDVDPSIPLSVQCNTTADGLRSRLGREWIVVTHEPFVIGGDLSAEQLNQCYHQTVVPIARALESRYFERSPRHPISVMLCSSDERFRQCNLLLDDQERSQYSGLYLRKQRRVIVNLASGEGTIAHELTHALAHANFPTMPEWFDEGLASLHEECEFSADGLQLIGVENWRVGTALDALHGGKLRLLEDVTSKRFGAAERATIDYAHVRSLCLYLQERMLLKSFYDLCRANSKADPTGLRSLCYVAEAPDPKTLDDAFRVWLLARRTENADRALKDNHGARTQH